jgi:hypothetical protein
MSSSMEQKALERNPWVGRNRRYDIVKEGTIALAIVSLLVLGLSAFLGSPDEPALTFQGWAKASPDNFYAVTVGELAGTTESAGYGPPYNDGGEGVAIGPINPAQVMGVTIPVDPANDFVIAPLSTSQQPAAVVAALKLWQSAGADQQATWATNYDTALNDPEGAAGDVTKVPKGEYGPVPLLAAGLTAMAQSGALDGILPAPGQFYNTDNTKQILFLGDSGYMDDKATAANLQGNTWGMMNEPGGYPGQTWLAPFSFWYQLPVFNSEAETGLAATLTSNGDIYIFAIIGVFMLLFLLLPFIPGLRDIPRWIPLHKLVWKQYYRDSAARKG